MSTAQVEPQAEPKSSRRPGSKVRRPVPAARLLATFGVLVVLTIAAVTGLLVWQLREIALQEAERDLANLNHVLKEHTAQAARNVDLLLRATVEWWSGLSPGQAQDLRLLHEVLGTRVEGVPQVAVLAMHDAAGRVLASTRSYPPPRVVAADQPFFVAHRDNPSLGLYVSAPQKSPVDGKWYVYFSRRLSGPQGEFAGDVAALVRPEFFTAFYEKLTLGEGSAVALMRSDAILLTRFPVREEWMGKSFAHGEVYQKILSKTGSGVVRTLSVVDNVPRIISGNLLSEYPLAVNVSITENVALATWHRWTALLVMGALLASGTFMALLWTLGRQIMSHEALSNVLRRSETRLREAQQIAHIGSWSYDPQSGQHDWSEEALRIIGYDPGRPRPRYRQFMEIIHTDDRSMVDSIVRAAFRGAHSFETECRIVRPDGHERWIQLVSEVLVDEAGAITRVDGTILDITDRKQSEDRIHSLAYFDHLTGLPNRTLLWDRLDHAIATAQRSRDGLAVLFFDLDRFKNINDSLGHHVGDETLKSVAERVRACLREVDTVARLGGDEFVIVLPDADAEGAARVARKIIDRLSVPHVVAGHELICTPSIGISTFPADGADAGTLVRNADAAMYHAKASGRNNYQFFTDDLNARVFQALAMEHSLRRAVKQGELFLVFQPQVSLRSGDVLAVEALLRWRHPDMGVVLPESFIPVAEESGLISAIGAWTLEEACRQARAWDDGGLPPITMSVNVSAMEFRQKEFLGGVRAALAASGLAPGRLELEVTETTVMAGAGNETADSIEQLRELGVQLAIDDFGTGYSSLSYLKRLPIEKLKIDRSFVRDVPEDKDDAAIVAAVVSLGKTLRLEVCAEGVERPDQIEFLRGLGCDCVQGFAVAAPMAAAEIASLLARRSTPERTVAGTLYGP